MKIGIEGTFLTLTKGIYNVRNQYSGYLWIKSKWGAFVVVMFCFLIWLPECGDFVIINLYTDALDTIQYVYYT